MKKIYYYLANYLDHDHERVFTEIVESTNEKEFKNRLMEQNFMLLHFEQLASQWGGYTVCLPGNSAK